MSLLALHLFITSILVGYIFYLHRKIRQIQFEIQFELQKDIYKNVRELSEELEILRSTAITTDRFKIENV